MSHKFKVIASDVNVLDWNKVLQRGAKMCQLVIQIHPFVCLSCNENSPLYFLLKFKAVDKRRNMPWNWNSLNYILHIIIILRINGHSYCNRHGRGGAFPFFFLLLPHTFWPVALEHFQRENRTKIPMGNTKVGLQVISFSGSRMFLVTNFLVLCPSQLLALDVCCYIYNWLPRKASYTSYGPFEKKKKNITFSYKNKLFRSFHSRDPIPYIHPPFIRSYIPSFISSD